MKTETKYKSQCAREAQKRNYGDKSYWDYLERASIEHSKYYEERGFKDLAKKMMTQSLGEALQGNNGN